MTLLREKHCSLPNQLNCPCGTETLHGLQQSHEEKLVSFASLLAISGTFNSLSKVLFIFPSRYLFAIGLRPIFSFRRKLPPILRTTSKVRDSQNRTVRVEIATWTGFSPSLTLSSKKTYAAPYSGYSSQDYNSKARLPIYTLSSSRFSRPY